MSKKLITLSVAIMATYSLVLGQQKDSLSQKNADATLDQVIVTANKVEQKQSSTGKVVTIISSTQIENNAGRTVAQLLTEQAGLHLPGSLSNAGTVPSIYMRGAASGRTLILIDGAPVGDPSMISNEFDLNLIPLEQIERIEILKGAQSTLYGSDAMGGVINIITKKKATKFLTGGLSYGNYGSKKGNLALNGDIKKWHYNIGFENQNVDGFSSAYDKTHSNNFDKDGYQNNSWFVKVQYKIDSNWSLQVSSQKTAYKAGIDYAAFKDDKDAHFNNATGVHGWMVKYKKAKTSLQAQYQYTTQDRSYINDSTDRTYLIYENNQYAGKTHFADLFLSHALSQNTQWIIGTDFRYGSYHQTYQSISEWGPYNSHFKDTFQFQNSIYSSFILNDNSKKWIVELGGRLNRHSRYGNNQTFTLSPSYVINEKLRAIASISSAYKAPSLYQISYNEKLKAETSINAEIGLEFKQPSSYLRVVYFNRTINNGIDYNYIDYNFFNFIKQKVNGFESEFKQSINDKQQISVNYTYMNGKETNQNRITNSDTITYNYLLKRPTHQLNLVYQIQFNKKWDGSLGARYISKRYDVGGYGTADVALDYYTLINAHLSFKPSRHISLYADVQNALNDHFQEIYGYNTIGRQFQLGISWH